MSGKNRTKSRAGGQQRDEQSARAESRRAQRVIAERKARRNRRLALVGGAAGIALLAVVALILVNSGGDDDAAAAPIVTPEPIDASIPRDGRVIGNPDAPVTVVEYGDYQCPACGQFARQIEPQLMADYIATGQVTFEYRDFPFLDDRADGSESDDAAEAAACAADQGKFWEYHRALFANQHPEGHENVGMFSRDRLVEIAAAAGLDTAAFESCLEEGTHAADVQAMADEALQRGVNSTPTFFVGDQMIVGANYAELREVIDAALGAQ